MKKKTFAIDYLINSDFEEDDLFYIFETNSLKYSLIYEMFKLANYDFSEEKINNIITKNNWQYKYFWNNSTRNTFRKELCDVYINIYNYSENMAYNKADEFLLFYGLTNSKLKRNKKIPTLED